MKSFIFIIFILVSQWAFSTNPPVAAKEPATPILVKKDLSKDVQERRLFTFDMGFGIPQLIGAQLSFRPFKKWQLGVGYGMLPGGAFNLPLDLGRQPAEFDNGAVAYFNNPEISTSLQTVAGFVRFFPSDNLFYLQFSMNVILSKNRLKSSMSDENGNTLSEGTLDGTIYMRQYVPTLSIGQLFAANLLFFNINLGLSYTGWVSVEGSEMGGNIPAQFGGNAGNQATFDKITKKIAASSTKGMNEIRKVIPFVPSFSLLFGFWF